MARAPFQILVIPHRRVADGTVRYALFRRADLGVWQGIAGGGEDAESPEQAARREMAEEAGIPLDAELIALDATARIPAHLFRGHERWQLDGDDIPEHGFGVAAPERLALSAEHLEYAWLELADAVGRLEWESNRAALRELHERLERGASGPARS